LNYYVLSANLGSGRRENEHKTEIWPYSSKMSLIKIIPFFFYLIGFY
jgi:hypothetical protein